MNRFFADRVPEPPLAIPAIKNYFKAYATSGRVRDIIHHRQFNDLPPSVKGQRFACTSTG